MVETSSHRDINEKSQVREDKMEKYHCGRDIKFRGRKIDAGVHCACLRTGPIDNTVAMAYYFDTLVFQQLPKESKKDLPQIGYEPGITVFFSFANFTCLRHTLGHEIIGTNIASPPPSSA